MIVLYVVMFVSSSSSLLGSLLERLLLFLKGGQDMRTGDIMLVQGKGLISKFIQFITGSPWTHAAICLGGEFILEIYWDKKAQIVRNTYKQQGLEYCILTHNTRLTTIQRKNITSAALGFHRTGNQYDWLLLFGLLIKAKFPNSSFARKLNQKNGFICTELADRVLQYAEIWLFPDSSGDIFPHEFLLSNQLHVVESSQAMLG
jgi:hypothetical protein